MNPALRILFKTVTSTHIFLYRNSGGRIWRKMLGTPVLILTTTGRKSGKQRTTPVVYNRDGENYLIAASLGGFDYHPGWYHNIKASSSAIIEVRADKMHCVAEILEGEERDNAYQIFKDNAKNFIEYEKRTERVIPVIRLIPQ